MSTPGLALYGLRVGWGATTILDDITLQVAAGETLALLGASGSGKSSLLRTVAGLLPAQGGRVHVAGRDVTDLPAHRRRVGMVFQAHALFPHATVGANISFTASLTGADRSARRRLAQRWLSMVGLDGMAERDVATLSGGQRQRVALARSLAAEPDVLLLDEPLGALDAGLRASLLADLRRLFDELGTTVIHVTHDPTEAATSAATIAVLDRGGIAQIGSPHQLHEQPSSATVARLLGHPNVVPAEALGLTPRGDATHVVVPTNAMALRDVQADTPPGRRATVELVIPGSSWTALVRTDTAASLAVTVTADDLPRPGEVFLLELEEARLRWVPRHSPGANEASDQPG